jgi:hypothetical protein
VGQFFGIGPGLNAVEDFDRFGDVLLSELVLSIDGPQSFGGGVTLPAQRVDDGQALFSLADVIPNRLAGHPRFSPNAEYVVVNLKGHPQLLAKAMILLGHVQIG